MKRVNNQIILAITLLFLGSIANAQTDTLLERDLKDVVVKENRIVIPFSASARNISIVTQKDLEVTPAVNYVEALNYVPGVDVRQRGPMGVQSDISIRGGTFDQTLVLLNGIKMSDPQTGHHAAYLPVSMLNIAQIEVVKGPAARIYGQNAFAGAVNVVTKVPEGRRLMLGTTIGQNDLLNTHIGLALPIRRYKQFISFNQTSSAGYQYNTDFSINNIFYQSEVKIGRGKLDLQAGHVQRKFGANGFYSSPAFVDQYEEVATSFAAASYRLTGSNYIVTPRVYWRRNHDDYVFLRQNPDVFNNIHTTNIIGGEVNSVISLKDDKGVIGIGGEVRNEDIVSSNLGDWNRTIAGLFGEYRWENDDFAVTPGVYINYYSDYGINAFPGVDVSYKMTSFSKIFANVGNSYRIPTYTDLYYVGRTNIGNPDLEPESAWTYELGYKYNRKGIFFQASGYYQAASSVIDWTRTVDTLPWQPTNLNNINSTGIELSADFRFDQILGKDSYLKRFYIGYHMINATLEIEDNVLSRYALEHLNNQLSVAVEHRIYKNLYNSMKFRFVDRVTMDNYSVFDAKVFWKTKTSTFFVEGTNLFNAEYRETNLVTMPGRWVRAGFTFDFGF
jgi:iron complex outermembrane receptor protein